ncbi:xylulokinase [Vibrio rhodolitus]|uniref:xylulokinase n=1 Tax=Vibrio rhodolitus TaxID=2231649 RepID=UPI000E0C470A|nr:xylulokinase [Vibrio rhodolitus]
MYLGIDLGTSGIKAVLMTEQGHIIASKTASLTISRPKELWSEQDPQEWWQATLQVIEQLASQHTMSEVKAIGLSGQMHGAVTLTSNGDIIRPAILWNDGRCQAECHELEEMVPTSRGITGNIMMPGFTAPKVKWLQHHEPENFAKIAMVLLPKDYLRFRLTGDYASDLSDSAGTMWLDVAKRDWSDEILAACGLSRVNMPKLYEGNQVTGYLTLELAKHLGMAQVPVVAGAGDNAAGAIGMGIIKSGQAMLSLGTSGVYFAVNNQYSANPESALHSFCHALPNSWHLMSVILSAASCLDWVAKLTHYDNVAVMLEDVEAHGQFNEKLVFLPYLSGERTPHNNPNAKGVFFGMSHETSRADLVLAVLEGVSFAFKDGFAAMDQAELDTDEITLIGGGAKSVFWRQMLANITAATLTYREGGDVGPALGAARLAQVGVHPEASLDEICPKPELLQIHKPDEKTYPRYQAKYQLYQQLYQRLHDIM